MINTTYEELINREELQLLQNEFCKVAGVYAYCLNEHKDSVTTISGTGAGVFETLSRDELNALQISPYAQRAIERVEEVDSLEDTAIEHFPGGKLAAVAARMDGKVLIYWMLIDCSGRSEMEFAQVADLVRNVSGVIFRSKLACEEAKLERSKSISEQQEMSTTLQRIEATTGIVQLLDSDAPIEMITNNWLSILGKQLQAETVELFQINADGTTMDVLAHWCNQDVFFPFEKEQGLDVCTMFRTERPQVYSTEGIPGEHRWEANHFGLSAVMIFPVIRQENGGSMVLTVDYRRKSHRWETTEVKFTADAVKVLQSILTRRLQKNSIAGSYAALEAVLNNVGCAIYVTDRRTGKMLFANRKLRNTFAVELQNGSFDALVEQGLSRSRGKGTTEVFHDDRARWYEMVYQEITWVDGKNVTLYSFYDITDRKLSQRRVEQQAYTDFLTGLYNRMCCEKDLTAQVMAAKRNGETGAIIYLDLDNFKGINDGLGHKYGDVLLQSISNALRRVEGLEGSCYRLGGDEFVVIISPEAYKQIDRIMQDVHDIFNNPWYLKDADYYCTASMGLVTFPGSGETVEELIKKADIAMYESKKSGKNSLTTYHESSSDELNRKSDMESGMRQATEDGFQEFEVYFQPIMRLDGEEPECIGAEALLRWNSSKLGFLAPAEFIPLAEYLGLINPIGNYVLLEACRYCKLWNEEGKPDFWVSVNLSVEQLLQNDIVEQVENAISETGIRPEHLMIEVTEGLAVNDMDRMRGILDRMRSMGVKIALDNFGTGYTSLNHLRELPMNMVKLDRNSVAGLADDAFAGSFVKSIVELAGVLGVAVCAEGVETAEQYAVLKNSHIGCVQGYYFDQPLSRRAFEDKYTKLTDRRTE